MTSLAVARPIYRDLRARHASQQYSDPTRQKSYDAKLALAPVGIRRLRPHIIGLTEIGKGQNPDGQAIMKTLAERLGYHAFFDGYEGGILTRFGAVLDHGYEGPMIPGKAGDHPHLGLNWVLLRHSLYPDIAYGVAHFLNRDHEPARARLNNAMARACTQFLAKKAGPNGVALLSGDSNRDDEPYDLLPGTGWTTCWDEAGYYPPTHGKSRTIDFVATDDADTNVHLKSARTLPLGFGDHNRVDATYRIAKKGAR